MVTICQTCGDEGFSNALIFCDKCQVYAVHRYCLPILPATFDECVVWLCENCASDVIESPDDKVSPFKVGETETESFKDVQVNKRNRSNNLKKKSKRRKVDTCSSTKSKVAGLEKCSSVQLLDVDCLKTIEKDKDFGTQDGLGERSSNEAVESLESKNSKLDPGDLQTLEVNCSDGQKDEKHGGQHVLDEGSINEEAECLNDKNSLEAIPLEANFPQDEETGQKLDERWNSMDEGHFHEATEPCNANNQLVISYEPNVVEQAYVHALPIQEPIWRGSLSILDKKVSRMVGLVAHVSNLACPKVGEEANSMPTSLSPELLPRSTIWPKGFAKSGPRDDSIALYFFPSSERNEKVFDGLVDDMIRRDCAMRVVVQNAELLIFSSTVLPMEFWRFQAKFYLWGVFKGKRSPHVAVDDVHEKEQRPLKDLTWDNQSPVSHLSNGSNNLSSVHSALSPSVL